VSTIQRPKPAILTRPLVAFIGRLLDRKWGTEQERGERNAKGLEPKTAAPRSLSLCIGMPAQPVELTSAPAVVIYDPVCVCFDLFIICYITYTNSYWDVIHCEYQK